MPERLALKRLTGSDLTFFAYHFNAKTFGESRQKAINLNAEVFLHQIYPDLAQMGGARINVLTTIYGPGNLGAFAPAPANRPILNNNGKNWRLNGSTIPDDPDIPDRFAGLRADDLALFRFRGNPIPREVDVILVSRAIDPAAHAVLSPLVPEGRHSMRAMTSDAINDALEQIALSPDHPLLDLRPDPEIQAEIEEVALGGRPGRALRQRRRGPQLTPEQLAAARADAGRIGSAGEGALFVWLEREAAAGRFSEVLWVARGDAAAPFDFTFRDGDKEVKIDAKSTSGPFSRPFHVSIGEVIEAARNDIPARYSIARIYRMDDEGARCRILHDFRGHARTIINGLNGLPEWSEPDSFRIDPDALPFDDQEIILAWPVPGEDDV